MNHTSETERRNSASLSSFRSAARPVARPAGEGGVPTSPRPAFGAHCQPGLPAPVQRLFKQCRAICRSPVFFNSELVVRSAGSPAGRQPSSVIGQPVSPPPPPPRRSGANKVSVKKASRAVDPLQLPFLLASSNLLMP